MSLERSLQRIAREEGIKNPEDIYDQTTFEEIAREIKDIRPNVKELFDLDPDLMNPEQKKCLDRTREFCNELSKNFSADFLSVIEEYQNEGRPISQKIIDYLLEKKFDLPEFTILQGQSARELLIGFDLDSEVEDKELLLVFQLPKPLARFWWKGGANLEGNESRGKEDKVIEWGHFYRELMGGVWHLQGYYENEKGLDFCRVNDYGEHDPKKFYYVWKMNGWQ